MISSGIKNYPFQAGDILGLQSSNKIIVDDQFGDYIACNVGTTVNHPPNHHCYRWYAYHSRMDGLLLFHLHQSTTLHIPSGNLTQLWKDPPFSMGKSTISMVIFNSYFDITRGYLFLREELDNETVTKVNHELGYMIHIIVTYDG